MNDDNDHISAFKGILLGALMGAAFYLTVVCLFSL